jgi:ATP-dependent helicase/nuclease subunit A
MEDQLVEMLKARPLDARLCAERDPDWDGLRERLERPLPTPSATRSRGQPASRSGPRRARRSARSPASPAHNRRRKLHANSPSWPSSLRPFAHEDSKSAHQAYFAWPELLLTGDGGFRKRIDKTPRLSRRPQAREGSDLKLIAASAVPGLESALAAVRDLPPARYTEDDWQIVRACFTLLRHAAGPAQGRLCRSRRRGLHRGCADRPGVLKSEDGLPTDAALAVADGIRHLLVDEFQDTSRRQHQLLAALIAAWPERTAAPASPSATPCSPSTSSATPTPSSSRA